MPGLGTSFATGSSAGAGASPRLCSAAINTPYGIVLVVGFCGRLDDLVDPGVRALDAEDLVSYRRLAAREDPFGLATWRRKLANRDSDGAKR
jgi:hypothetical protein